MPEGLLQVVALLSVGYVLLLLEIFVPGGVLGVLGGLAVVWGCYEAFELGPLWGLASIVLSVVVTIGLVVGFLRSRAAKRLVLSGGEPKSWKAQNLHLPDLVGKEGRTLSSLRPAGLAEIGGDRVDVVTDSEFLDAGVRVRVIEVEGNRVVVEETEASRSPPPGRL
ncbi:MAG TPA: NfeD family protein [Thermoanaerobaculia bacterium]|jgi:membrane-bound serine protease (ClpP class)